jgi:hypothetical protein
MQVSQTDIIGGTREEFRHMTFDKPVVFDCIIHPEVMYCKTFSLKVK